MVISYLLLVCAAIILLNLFTILDQPRPTSQIVVAVLLDLFMAVVMILAALGL